MGKKEVLRIGLDVDGVMTDGFADTYLEVLNGQASTSFVKDDITDFYMSKCLDAPKRAHRQAFEAACAAVPRYEVDEEMFEAWEALAREPRIEVYFVTSPVNGQFAKDRMDWLYKHFSVGPDQVVVTSAKHLLARNIQILIDDKYANILAFREEDPMEIHGSPVLFERPWNRKYREEFLNDGGSVFAKEEVIECLMETIEEVNRV